LIFFFISLSKFFFIKLLENKKKFYIKIKNLELDLSKAKYLLIRQNPPFNLEYINSTLYLEKLLSIILQAFVPIEPVAPKIDTFFKKNS